MRTAKVLTYSYAINQLSDQERSLLARCDAIVCADRPEEIAKLREVNPNLQWIWKAQPQHCKFSPNPSREWWWEDRKWSPLRAFQAVASSVAPLENWFLKDTKGRIITDGIDDLINWTPLCPRAEMDMDGTPDSMGMRASEYFFHLLNRYIEEQKIAIQGVMLEVMADCLGTMGPKTLDDADPDQDGIAEGVNRKCSEGGTRDILSILMRCENRYILPMIENLPVPVYVNDHTLDAAGPDYSKVYPRPLVKMENWHHKISRQMEDSVRVRMFEEMIATPVFALCYYGDQVHEAEFVLACSMLKDCYFMWSKAERLPVFKSEKIDLDLGDRRYIRKNSYGEIEMQYDKGRVCISPHALRARWE